MRRKETIQSRLKDEKLLSFFDVDARAELRSVPFSAIWFPPRVGEQVELRADVEYGGGLYLVVGIRHILEDSGPTLKQSATVVRVIVDVKPQHATTAQEDMTAADLKLEEIMSVSVMPLPITIELPAPLEPEK